MTDTMRVSSSAKDEGQLSMACVGAGAGAGVGAGAGAGAGATLVELLPNKSTMGKSAAFFLHFACSN